MANITRKEEAGPAEDEAAKSVPRRGLLVVYSPFMPQHCFFPMSGESLGLGRDELLAAGIEDEFTSKRHLRVDWNGQRVRVSDEGSTNGTFLNGRAVSAPVEVVPPAVVRIGRTLLLCLDDARFAKDAAVCTEHGVIIGPKMQAIFDKIGQSAAVFESLLIIGESGSGKELAAQRFHAAGPRPSGPFVPVNCAAIPRELAERLLFGARRGAYSGAVADADGHVQAAHGGTLFLDEIIDLDLANQAKLLRVLENREVQALGASRPQRIDLRLCAAAQHDLRQEVADGRMREDLYFRIGRPALHIPPLRERLEEIPWLIDLTVREFVQGLPPRSRLKLSVSANFVETCLLRPWPGNVRELRTETRSAVLRAVQESARMVVPQHLGEEAGQPIQRKSKLAAPQPEPSAPEPQSLASDDIEPCIAALRNFDGNINRAAQELGMTRSKLRRLIERHQIDIEELRRGG